MPATTTPRFVHLHLHSEYSLLDGANRLKNLVKRVKELGMDSVAVTDHGNLFAAAEFYKIAKAQDIKPILGIEAYVTADLGGRASDRLRKKQTGVADGGFHLVLLAENQTGWQNLLKLSSDAYIKGFYHKPQMDKTTLTQWAKGLIAINGHLGSSIAHHLCQFVQTKNKAHYDRAKEEALWHAKTFGQNEAGEPNFFLELQVHDIQEQLNINPYIKQLAAELDIPLVGDNDAHYLLKDDYDAHDTLCCISMGKIKQDDNRLKYSRDLYVKSQEEMVSLFADTPQALENTIKIADRCNVTLDFSANHAPVVRIELSDVLQKIKADTPAQQVLSFQSKYPTGTTEWLKDFCAQIQLHPFDQTQDSKFSEEDLKAKCDQALRLLSEAGAIWRYGEKGITPEIRARLERELKVLADKIISAYFLIVWDFVNEARRRNIPSNARGSGVGTMVGYCLGLSNACPVEYGLLFERFTDPDRSEYPDIDIDICQNGRQEIIEYVREKYGYVAQIITFNVMKAKAALRDVGRVFDIPLAEVDKIVKLIPDALNVTLSDAMAQSPEFRQLYDDNPTYRRLIDTALQLEGMTRHSGIHAAGVVVATQPLDNIIPLCTARDTPQVITQWDGPTVEKVGLLKMDFLGLRTLSIIEKACSMTRETLDEQTIYQTVNAGKSDEAIIENPLDMDRLKFEDPEVLALFQRGETEGVFQFESGGMRNLLMAMKPDRLEDLIAANALYRPGPMDLIPDYNDRKHGRAPVPKVHEIVDRQTRETYGIMVYQEQVMLIVHELGGIPLRAAYTLIKAISKKKSDVIDSNRKTFIEGASGKGLAAKQANDLFDLILKFAGYGFNKSHSTGYAIVAYQTAFLKHYFPVQYMASLLTFESGDAVKVVKYIEECRKLRFPDGHRGVDVKAPDINLSVVGFTVVYGPNEPRDANHGVIRFGLSAVKGVGEKAILSIIAQREKEGPFTSLYDFCERVSLSAVNRATIDALIKCGAFDSLHSLDQRAAMINALDEAIRAGQRLADDRSSGQMSFFDTLAANESTSQVAKASEMTLPNLEPWPTQEMLQYEKSVLGFFVSSHPLDKHTDTLERFANISIADIRELAANFEVIVGGMLTRIRQVVTKRGKNPGQKMAMITIEDKTGPIDGVVFSNTYAISQNNLVDDNLVFLRGKIDRKREEPSIVVEEIIPIEQAAQRLTQAIKIKLHHEGRPPEPPQTKRTPYNGELTQLKMLLRQSQAGRGEHGAHVLFEISTDDQLVHLRIDQLKVQTNNELPGRIETVLKTPSCCQLIGPKKIQIKNVHKDQLHDDAAPAERLERHAATDEFCDSIDRY